VAKSFTEGYKTYNTANGFGSAKKWKQTFYQRMSREKAEEIISRQAETPEQILGVKHGAGQQEIKLAFRYKMKEWHPDFNPHRIDEATVMAQKINAAYEILKN